MALVTWDDRMSVNMRLVDGRHMKLVEILTSFMER